ncbi:uncharacterized protein EDB91DRAFT_1094791 [Suillus paluster]|uniref:uncharacterized protein n=1 Tax=Suillus paluster TaxID=48578 RepID=UPI001B86BD78|nr:uncharacterized protein EDB91DRAFT_1094791 [Suillus paluster]KAG1756849.1 hypothetical protein EDB91DRAFT_1094791 [Suillus paluster]
MRLCFVLAVIAALTASIFASPVDSRSDAEASHHCHVYCNWEPCCHGEKCMLSRHLGMRERLRLWHVAAANHRRVSAFASVLYGWHDA